MAYMCIKHSNSECDGCGGCQSHYPLREECDRCSFVNDDMTCNYGKEMDMDEDSCWLDRKVECRKCRNVYIENENAELYCEYHGEFCKYDTTECEFYEEGE